MILSWIFTCLSPALFAQPQIPCDPARNPVVFVHGFLGSGDNWALQAQRLEANGYCPSRIFAFDWNSLNRQSPSDSLLEVFIRRILAATGAVKVDLVAHSAGGGVCSRYLSRADRAVLVSRYVHIGSSPLSGQPGGIPTMNIYSAADKVAARAGDIPGAENVRQTDNDHLQVVTSEESFRAIFGFLQPRQKPHAYLKVPGSCEVSGMALVLGENTPLRECRIEAWVHDTITGMRKTNRPEWTGTTDSSGRWSGFRANPSTAYEFVLQPAKGRVVHYFMEPFRYHNRFLYLRSLPSTGMAAMLLAGLPADPGSSVLAVFAANGAIITGRDTLNCNGTVLSTGLLTPAQKSCIAMFLYDAGKDGAGTGAPIPLFGGAPFLNGADLFLPASMGESIRLHYNGRTRVLPSIPSSEGVMVAVYD
jgi:pimeloyl-ACP methyl ester carboxylesterase